MSLILLSAGNSTRFNYSVKKQWLRVGNKPLWLFVADNFKEIYNFDRIVVVANKDDVLLYEKMSDYLIVSGGEERQFSLKKALDYVDSEFVMVSDVARACLDKEVIKNILKETEYDCVVPYLNVVDTVVYKDKTINRDEVKLIQTPQLSKTKLLKKALNQDTVFTDERAAIESIQGNIKYIKGSEILNKITYFKDLKNSCLKPPSKDYFSGVGYDSHRFEKNKKMYLGGVLIDVDYGFKAHSDGDVVIHSLIDALLGASGYGDIGDFFPDSDERYKNISSVKLLEKVKDILSYTGYEIVNIDITIIAQKPILKDYKLKIQRNLKSILNTKVNIKATTNEKMGFVGREEGVAVISNTTLKYKDWYEDCNCRE